MRAHRTSRACFGSGAHQDCLVSAAALLTGTVLTSRYSESILGSANSRVRRVEAGSRATCPPCCVRTVPHVWCAARTVVTMGLAAGLGLLSNPVVAVTILVPLSPAQLSSAQLSMPGWAVCCSACTSWAVEDIGARRPASDGYCTVLGTSFWSSIWRLT